MYCFVRLSVDLMFPHRIHCRCYHLQLWLRTCKLRSLSAIIGVTEVQVPCLQMQLAKHISFSLLDARFSEHNTLSSHTVLPTHATVEIYDILSFFHSEMNTHMKLLAAFGSSPKENNLPNCLALEPREIE